MNKEKELELIKEGLSYCDYNELTSENWYDNVARIFSNKYKGTLSWYDDIGASKGVIIFNSLGLVIKIPFKGYDDYYDDEYNFFYFEQADTKCGWNYCEVEYERYQKAISAHVEECFAKVEKFAEINNHPIYIQDLAVIHAQDKHYISDEEINSVRDFCSNSGHDCFCLAWLVEAFKYYGKELFDKLLSFIEDTGIEDLHGNNLGYINGKPVVVDFAGFQS